MDYLDLHTAKTKMQLRNINHCVSFVSTLWKNEVILCTFNNIQKSIVNIFCCSSNITPSEFATLEQLIAEFIFGDDNDANIGSLKI